VNQGSVDQTNRHQVNLDDVTGSVHGDDQEDFLLSAGIPHEEGDKVLGLGDSHRLGSSFGDHVVLGSWFHGWNPVVIPNSQERGPKIPPPADIPERARQDAEARGDTMSDGKISSSGYVALKVGNIQTACIAVAWALDTLAPEDQSPLTPQKRFEVIAGMGFILDLMSKELGEVYGLLNGD